MSSRHRALLAMVLGVSLGFVGLVARRDALVVLSIPPMTYAAALILSDHRVGRPVVAVHRDLDATRVREEQDTNVHLTVSHRGTRPIWITLTDEITEGMHVRDGEHRMVARLGPGEARSATYSIQVSRGAYAQREAFGAIWAPWGLAVRDLRVRAETELTALPDLEPVEGLEIHPSHTHGFAGSIRTQQAGSGLDFLGVRTYELGDDIRRINWRASARREDPIVNVFEQEKMTEVNLIVDARSQSHLEVEGVQTFESVLRGAGGLAAHFLRQGHRVGLLLYGDSLDWSHPAAGRLQLEKILYALAHARPASRAALNQLRYIPTQRFTSGSQLILFSSLSGDGDERAPEQLVARGYSVLLVYPDTARLEERVCHTSPHLDLARRVLALRKDILLGRLAQSGVDVASWDLMEPLQSALHAVSLRGPRRGRR